MSWGRATALAAPLASALAAASAGDRRALSRLLSYLEDSKGGADRLAQIIHQQVAHRPPVLGITGPPGAGKSTLTNALVGRAVDARHCVGVLAVDPSSPITGGALLGDRVRMVTRAEGTVFFRSLANRGAVGGLARVVPAAIDLLSLAGYTLVIVETVGAGQSEIEIAAHADLTAVVLSPQSGDATQAGKAGLMEIGDVIVLNKADLPGAKTALIDLRGMVQLRSDPAARVPVVKLSAVAGEGVEELWKLIEERLAGGSRARPKPRRVPKAGVGTRLAAAIDALAAEGGLPDDHPLRRPDGVEWALDRLELG